MSYAEGCMTFGVGLCQAAQKIIKYQNENIIVDFKKTKFKSYARRRGIICVRES